MTITKHERAEIAAAWMKAEPKVEYSYVMRDTGLPWDKGEPDPRWPQSWHRAAADFPVGTRVRVVCRGQDFMFFRGTETGKVVRNGDRYLSIEVRFDEPIYVGGPDPTPKGFKTWSVERRNLWLESHCRRMDEFNFEPSDLIVEGEEWPSK